MARSSRALVSCLSSPVSPAMSSGRCPSRPVTDRLTSGLLPLDALLVRTSFTQSVLHPPCPDDLWNHCWHCAYHAIFYLDYYATRSDQEFTPPEPFGLSELEPNEKPARIYSKKELLIYLSYASAKCKLAVEAMTDDSLTAPCLFKRRNLTVAELFLYNMRQVQHHTGQLNLMISQHLGQAPRWVQSSHL